MVYCIWRGGAFDVGLPARGKKGRVERWLGGVGFDIIPVRGFPVCVSIVARRAERATAHLAQQAVRHGVPDLLVRLREIVMQRDRLARANRRGKPDTYP
jgi:hypothetical protein